MGRNLKRRLTTAATLAAFLFCAWVAAPALSLAPYIPGAEDFESSLPAPKRLAGAIAPGSLRSGDREHRARWISPPVSAPDRFDLVGVADEMRPLEIRVRDAGGEWSDWVDQDDGTPIYVDGADDAQVRASFRPRGRLHFVNVSGTSGSFADRLLDDARESVNSAAISIASTPVAEAVASKPLVVPRATWGADLADGGCPPRGPAEYGSVNAAVVHHTVNANDYSPEDAAGIVLGICRFHVNANGWNDIGYNALVDRYGTIYEGRAGGLKFPVVGAQAQGFNSETTSIASIGDHTSETIAKPARSAIVNFLAWKLKISLATPANGSTVLTSGGGSQNRYPAGTPVTAPRIVGHGTLGLTECPGTTLAPEVAKIAAGVQKRLKGRAARKKKKRKARRASGT